MKRIDAYVGKNDSSFNVAATIFDLKIIKLWVYQNADAFFFGWCHASTEFLPPIHFSNQFRLSVLKTSLAENKNGIFGLSNKQK